METSCLFFVAQSCRLGCNAPRCASEMARVTTVLDSRAAYLISIVCIGTGLGGKVEKLNPAAPHRHPRWYAERIDTCHDPTGSHDRKRSQTPKSPLPTRAWLVHMLKVVIRIGVKGPTMTARFNALRNQTIDTGIQCKRCTSSRLVTLVMIGMSKFLRAFRISLLGNPK